MKRLFLLLIMVSLTSFFETIKAQGTLKNTSISFLGEDRDISIYIPSNYSSDIPAKLLIGLHGSGDNCRNYINVLAYRFPELSIPNTIIICPDGGNDIVKDFYQPEGDEAIIDSVIAYAKNNYNIDASEIILQGFSLGGRSALKYGLDFPEKFKGLLLNTPAIQGVKEAVTEGYFQYANASRIPMYITHGEEDMYYTGPIDSMRLQLALNNGKVLFHRFPIGHDIPSMNNMNDFYQFINTLYVSDYDLEVVQIDIPSRTCEISIPFSVLVQNKGTKNLTNIKFSYSINEGNPLYYLWEGNIEPFQHLKIDFPNLNVSHGSYLFTVKVDSLNNSFKDTIGYNNLAEAVFDVATEIKTLPYIQTFSPDDIDDEWDFISSGDLYRLFYDSDREFFFSANSVWNFDNIGRKEEIVSPLLDLTSISNPSITFDIAYAYTLYTENFTGDGELIFADTLEVLITTDCGKTFKSLYKKGGKELLTFNEPLTDIISMNSIFSVSPSSNDWRREWIDLSPYAGNTSAAIKFSYISAQGGIMFLDNVAFSNETANINSFEMPESILIYPNPAQDYIAINSGGYLLKLFNLYDVFGKKVGSYDGNNESFKVIDLTGMNNGIYIAELITTCGKKLTRKIIVKR